MFERTLRKSLAEVVDVRIVTCPWNHEEFPGYEAPGVQFQIPCLRADHAKWAEWLSQNGLDKEEVNSRFRRAGAKAFLTQAATRQAGLARKGFRSKKGATTALTTEDLEHTASAAVDAVIDDMTDAELESWFDGEKLNHLKPGIAEILIGHACELAGRGWEGIREGEDDTIVEHSLEAALRLLEWNGVLVYDKDGDHWCISREQWLTLDQEHPAALAFQTLEMSVEFLGGEPKKGDPRRVIPEAPEGEDGEALWPYSEMLPGDAFARLMLDASRELSAFVPTDTAADLGSTPGSDAAASSPSAPTD